MAPELSVIVPVFNESHLVRAAYDAVRLAPPWSKEIIIVDDGSTDDTSRVLSRLPRDSALTVLAHRQNTGKGAAIRTALAHASGRFVLIQDADLEYDPRDYVALLGPLRRGEANVVYGVRSDSPGRGWLYYAGARLLTLATNLLFGSCLHDEATCYKAFRRSTLLSLQLRCRRFEFCPEVTAKLLMRGERIAEVPVRYKPRSRAEGKKVRATDGVVALRTLLGLRIGWPLLDVCSEEAVMCEWTVVRSPDCGGGAASTIA